MPSKLHHYAWSGMHLAAGFEIPELPPFDLAPPARSWSLTLQIGRAPRRPGRTWFHRWRYPGGRRAVAFARDSAGYVLRFPGLADFDVRPQERQIDGYAAPDVPAHTVRHLLLDQVLPLIAGTPHSLALHGSVVGTSAGAIAFLGESGVGKSTLAAKLGRRGCTVLSDDCCLIERAGSAFIVVPSYPGVRLNDDSARAADADDRGEPVAHYSAKRRVTGGGFAFGHQALPLARVYVIGSRDTLERATKVSVSVATKRDAMYALIDYTFHLDVAYAPRIRETFELAADIVERHGVHQLAYPWSLGSSDVVADAVLADTLAAAPIA